MKQDVCTVLSIRTFELFTKTKFDWTSEDKY